MDIKFEHCLQLSNSQLASGIAIAMHSDGKTYGPDPGPFGRHNACAAFCYVTAC